MEPKSMADISEINIRPYTEEDRGAMLQIMADNTPHFFTEEENGYFATYLSDHADTYLVAEIPGSGVVGGGDLLVVPEKRQADFCWGMVSPDMQGKGVGKKLAEYRIEMARHNPLVDEVVCRTSQLTWRFYEKMGFKLLFSEENHWGPGLHLYEMAMEI